MCRIKSGEAISSNEDIRNLITSVILRQKKEYRKDYILTTVFHYLNGSKIPISNKKLSQLVDDGLDILGRNGEVSCWNGLYKTAGMD